MADNSIKKTRWFRNMAPYINAHRGKTFVVAFGGEALSDPNFPNLLHEIGLLSSLGVKLVLIPGCRPQIESRLQASGIKSSFVAHRRVTTPDVLERAVEAALTVKNDIEAKLTMGLPNTPMQGSKLRVCSGNFIIAQPIGIVEGRDLQFTGKVRRVDSEAILNSLDFGAIVLQSTLGHSLTGETFNLTLEDVAVSIASEIISDKLILFCDAEGLQDKDGLIRQCRATGVNLR